LENNIEYVGNVKLDYEFYGGTDLYVDGSEEKLLDIVKRYNGSEYNKVIDEEKQWPVLYHLSNLRGNIVDCIPFTKNDKVLEIGAGCGAITGTIAKRAGKVDCIELSRIRSLVNAERNKHMDNIVITVGNFQDIERKITEKYDYITLIGVLEYAGKYIASDNPYEDFIIMLKKHLNENGKIVLAIENKYGLKYWAGCREDHLGTFFSGIEGYVDTYDVRTFSKKELQKIFVNCGLNDVTFYYPYPDYKFPITIYSDSYLPKTGSLSNNMNNFDSDRLMLFDELKVYDNLIADGMFDFFSNSFMVIAGL